MHFGGELKQQISFSFIGFPHTDVVWALSVTALKYGKSTSSASVDVFIRRHSGKEIGPLIQCLILESTNGIWGYSDCGGQYRASKTCQPSSWGDVDTIHTGRTLLYVGRH